jgi:carbon monoxide dehydrogenase subunit G
MRNLTDFGFQCLQMSVIGLCGIGMALAQTPNSAPHPAKVAKKKEPSKSMPMAQEPELAPHEISIAERVHVGTLPCEMGASVRMTADANAPGYFTLQGKGYKYRMRPVATSTGAIRLEDEKAGAVWLQLANKSMLMDQKNGRRLADECAHPDQVAVANDMKVNPPPALIDVSNAATPVRR